MKEIISYAKNYVYARTKTKQKRIKGRRERRDMIESQFILKNYALEV